MEIIIVDLKKYEDLKQKINQLMLDKKDLQKQLEKRLVVHKQGVFSGYKIYADDTAMDELFNMMQALENRCTSLQEQLYSLKRRGFFARLLNLKPSH